MNEQDEKSHLGGRFLGDGRGCFECGAPLATSESYLKEVANPECVTQLCEEHWREMKRGDGIFVALSIFLYIAVLSSFVLFIRELFLMLLTGRL